jgi:hypothetical protein
MHLFERQALLSQCKGFITEIVCPGMYGCMYIYAFQRYILSCSRLAEHSSKTFIPIYDTMKFLPVVLYGCETWPLTLREEHRLKVFENRVLRMILGPKRDDVTGVWRKLHNEELLDLYSSPSIIRIIKSRRMRWAGHVARMGEKRNAYRLLVGKQEGKKPLGRPRRRWVDNIRMDLGEVGMG